MASIAGIKPIVFIKEVKQELAMVSWPTRAQAIRLTTIVIAVSIIVGVYIGALDFMFTKITETVVRK